MPFFETAEDATYSAIMRSGKSIKAIAIALWPSMKADSAYARLSGSLKGTRPEKLLSDEHLFIANFCGEYDWLYYNASACHHSRPEQIAPEDEKESLQREFISSVENLSRMANQIKALSGGWR